MLFSSMLFLWIFLPVVFIISRLLKTKQQNIFLLLVSLLFYAWGEPKYVLLMLFSIFLNWGSGILLHRFLHFKRMILTGSIISEPGTIFFRHILYRSHRLRCL